MFLVQYAVLLEPKISWFKDLLRRFFEYLLGRICSRSVIHEAKIARHLYCLTGSFHLPRVIHMKKPATSFTDLEIE